jgi:hypothetical protein
MQFSSDLNVFSTSGSDQTASLPFGPVESILPPATPSVAGTKRGPVPKRRFQKGTFVKRGNNWVGMWRVDTLQPEGTMKREQRSRTFVGLSERAARATFQPILDAVNAANQATPPVPKTSDTVAKAVAEWREHAAGTLKPSTLRSAESHLRRHILPSTRSDSHRVSFFRSVPLSPRPATREKVRPGEKGRALGRARPFFFLLVSVVQVVQLRHTPKRLSDCNTTP